MPVLLRKILRPIFRILRFILWAFATAGHLIPDRGERAKRVLVIYDVLSQPFSIGDFLTCLEAASVLCAKHNVELADLAIVYDHKNPTPLDPIFRALITHDNITYHLSSILSVSQVNDKLGSILIFNSPRQLHRHIASNTTYYHVWPSGWKIATRQYLSRVVFNDLLYDYYKKHGSIPYLTCRPFLVEWANDFFRRNLAGHIPVTVNIRNNKGWHLHRNSNLDAWIGLFNYCEKKFAAKFIVICAYSEIDEQLRNCKNVLIAKDYHTGVEQDMALIYTSAMHMGAGSGPATMAWFNYKPYLMVNTAYETSAEAFLTRDDMIIHEQDHAQRFWFSNASQRIVNGVETTDILIREFTLLWQSANLKPWQEELSVKETTLPDWLR